MICSDLQPPVYSSRATHTKIINSLWLLGDCTKPRLCLPHSILKSEPTQNVKEVTWVTMVDTTRCNQSVKLTLRGTGYMSGRGSLARISIVLSS